MKLSALWALIAGFFLLHLYMAATIGLADDEAYYTLWATVPSLGYYDHPPMIAWWIALGQKIVGAGPLGIRLLPVIAASLVTGLVYRIIWLLCQNHRAALFGAVFASAMMPFSALAFVASPDAPSVLFWTLAVWALTEAQTKANANWWLVVGVFAGLGVQSKFTNLFFGVGLLTYLLGSGQGRKWLGSWQVWAGAVLALVVIAPQVLWNYQHDWIGLERQFGRLGTLADDSLENFSALSSVAAYMAALVATITPVIFWLALRGVLVKAQNAALLWTTLPLLVFLALYALTTTVGANWPLPVYPVFAVFAGLSVVSRPRGWCLALAAPFALVLSFGLLVAALWPGKPIFPGNHPFNQAKGWPEFVAEIKAVAKSEDVDWIATDIYPMQAQMYHHLSADFPVWSMTQPERYGFRGPMPDGLCNQKILLVTQARAKAGDQDYFKSYQPLGTFERRSNSAILLTYTVGVGSGIKPGVSAQCP